jgi:hypothetical protein
VDVESGVGVVNELTRAILAKISRANVPVIAVQIVNAFKAAHAGLTDADPSALHGACGRAAVAVLGVVVVASF